MVRDMRESFTVAEARDLHKKGLACVCGDGKIKHLVVERLSGYNTKSIIHDEIGEAK